MRTQIPHGMGGFGVDGTAETGCRDGRIGSAALTANKAVRPRRKTGTGPTTTTLLRSQ